MSDGVSNFGEFLAGTEPTDPHSVQKTRLVFGPREKRLIWNTLPGLIYQVQVSGNFSGWSNLGSPRFATGSTDSLVLVSGQASAYYRVVRLR